MIDINIPGRGRLMLQHLVLDYNGTLATDGELLEGVRERLRRLAPQVQIHVVTADTFGQAAAQLDGLDGHLSILAPGAQALSKLRYVKRLGSTRTACVGNGRNDRLMLREATLGIVVLGAEGAAMETMMAADVVAPDILAALDLLIQPLRLVATLRS